MKPEVERRLLRDFAHTATERLSFPTAATIVGMPVDVVKLFDSGHPRRGLLCCCRRHGLNYTIDFLAPAFPEGSEAAALQATYRSWLKLPSSELEAQNEALAPERTLHTLDPAQLGFHGVPSRHKHPADPTFDGDAEDFLSSLAADHTVTLAVTSCKATRLRGRMLEPPGPEVILYTQHHDFIPSEILTIQVTAARMRHRSLTLTGNVLQARADVPALGLAPLALHAIESSPADGASHPRPRFELALPLAGLPLADAVAKAYETHLRVLPLTTPTSTRKLPKQARYPLFDLLAQDLRCLDAYAYLGEFALDQGQVVLAQRYFIAGAQVASLSLELAFDDLLPWDAVGNRGLLRCLRGQALSHRAMRDHVGERIPLDRLRALDPGAIQRWPGLFQ